MDAAIENGRLKGFFSGFEWLLYGALVVAALVLRWLLLDMRPLHHDESLHLMYGFYFFDHPDHNFYKYEPMLHGPMLYTLLPLIYNTFGVSHAAARAPIALIGTLFVFVPLIFRRFLSARAVLALTAVLALSPTCVYWSRFLREDYLVLLWWLLVACGVLLVPARFKALLVMLGVTLQFCTKENSYVTAALIIGYLMFEDWYSSWLLQDRGTKRVFNKGVFGGVLGIAVLLAIAAVLLPDIPRKAGVRVIAVLAFFAIFFLNRVLVKTDDTLLAKMVAHIGRYKWHALFALGACALTYAFFFTAGFRYGGKGPGFFEQHFGVLIDGLYRKSIVYWVNQDKIERIKGPFLFHFYTLSWYEFPFVLAFALQVGMLFKRSGKWLRVALGAVALGTVIAALSAKTIFAGPDSANAMTNSTVFQIFKLKDVPDLIGLCIMIPYALIVTVHHLARRERALAFWAYFFSATLFAYSYLGEKVPWLSLYPFVTGLIYFTLFFDQFFAERPRLRFEQVPVYGTLLSAGFLLVVFGLVFTGRYAAAVGLFLAWMAMLTPRLKYLHVGWVIVAIDFVMLWGAKTVYLNNFKDNRYVLGTGLAIIVFTELASMLGYFGTYRLKPVLFILLAGFMLRAAILTNFTYGGEASEFLSQVHTTYEFHAIAERIKDEIRSVAKGHELKVLAEGDAVWPMTAYMVGLPQYKFSASEAERSTFDYIIQDYKDTAPQVPGFEVQKITLRGWWVPDYNDMTLKRFLDYSINHRPWNGTGFSYAYLLSRKQ